MAINFQKNLPVARWLYDDALKQGMKEEDIASGSTFYFEDDKNKWKIFQIQVGTATNKKRGFVLQERVLVERRNQEIIQEIDRFRSNLERIGIPLIYPNPAKQNGIPSIALDRIKERETYERFKDQLNIFLRKMRTIIITLSIDCIVSS